MCKKISAVMVVLILAVTAFRFATVAALERGGDTITGITLDYNSITKVVGNSFKIGYRLTPSGANSNNITWKSSNQSVATVNSSGLVVCKSIGNATITAVSTESIVSAKCIVNVTKKTTPSKAPTSSKKTKIAIDNIHVDRTLIALTKGDSTYLKAEILPTNATNKALRWSSSDNEIVYVDAKGCIIANQIGEAFVSAVSVDGAKTSTCKVLVTPLVSPENQVEASNKPLPFHDVSASSKYYDSIKYVHDAGLMTGISESKFGSTSPVTRAMIAAVLYRMEGKPSVNIYDTFIDVQPKDWFARAVMWVNDNEISSGVGAKRFAPNDTLTREQLVTILSRYANFKGIETKAYYVFVGVADEEDISQWSLESMKWAFRNKLIGLNKAKLNPQKQATREDVARALHVFMTEISNVKE